MKNDNSYSDFPGLDLSGVSVLAYNIIHEESLILYPKTNTDMFVERRSGNWIFKPNSGC